MRKEEFGVLDELDFLRRRVSELRKSDEGLKRIIANAPDILYRINLLPKLHFEYLSPSMTSITGYDYQDFIKDFDAYMQIIHPDDRELVSSLSRGSFIPKIRLRWTHKDGHLLIVEAYRMPIYDEQGRLIAVEGITRNITERYRLQEELRIHKDHLENIIEKRTNELRTINQQLVREIEFRKRVESELKKRIEYEKLLTAKFYTLLQDLPMLVHIQKPDYTIAFANRYFCQHIGEPGQRRCYEVIEGRQKPCEPCLGLNVIKTKSSQDWEWVRSNGQTFHIYNFPLSDIDGTPMVLVLGIDITGRKEMEKELARLDRMDLVGQMAAGIGHEVRNPMTTVRGFLQMLKGKKESDSFKEYFDLMIGELDRANAIITEYLSLAKKRATDIKIQSLNNIIDAMKPLLEVNTNEANINLEVSLGKIPDLPLDDKEIRQLIMNLTRNAVEAMPDKGTLTVRTYQAQRDVILAVEDEGTGIPLEIMEKLGTPFLTTKDQGTGLGLAVCYSIAARHEAKIDVQSSSSGTTFFVRFSAI